MSFVFKWFSRLPNYLKAFGVFHGLRLLFSVEYPVPRKSAVIEKYSVPGYSEPIYLRKTVSDHSIFWQCIVRRQYDISHFLQTDRLMSTYSELVEKGIRPVIIDCGGNIGLSTLYFGKVFPEATIFVVEPDNDNFEILKLNTAALGDRVVPLKGGIWNESCNLRIINPESGSAAFRVEVTSDSSNDTIRAYTIEEICKLAGVESPLIVKIDIEGSQRHLFTGNTNWVSNTHLVMLELDDWVMPWQGTSNAFFKCISHYSFDYLISGETIFCFRNFEQA